MKLYELPISDGRIVETISQLDRFVITFIDWKENLWELIFMNVIAIESFSPEEEDLDRIEVSQDDPLINRARVIAKEPALLVSCYAFFSTWSDKAVLRVVANDCQVSHHKKTAI